MSIIRTENLVKEFRRRLRDAGRFSNLRALLSPRYETMRAVDGISFEVGKGELVGFLGPNGAGKSTTIKMLTGVLAPSSGRIEVDGRIPHRERRATALKIGVVFGQRTQLWWDLPLKDSFRLIATIYEVPENTYKANLDHLVELLEMSSFLNTPVRSLSLGQRMRGDLAAAMLYEPSILFLDEPTVGLDVVAKQRMRELIAEMNRERGTTVLLTTHDMDDVEALCQRVLIIDHGAMLYDGAIQPLKASYAPHRDLIVHFAEDIPPLEGEVRRDEDRVWLRFDPSDISASTLIREITDKYDVLDLSLSEPDLEAVIAEIYASDLRG